MILIALALQASPVAVEQPTSPPAKSEEWVMAVARQAIASTIIFRSAVADDPALRREFRRVGFHNGCEILHTTSQDAIRRHGPSLEPLFSETVRRHVPDFLGDRPPFRALMMMRGKITDEVERSGNPVLSQALADMKQAFVASARSRPPARHARDNLIKPEPALKQALNVGKYWDLDNPAQLLMACADERTPDDQRPHISNGAPRR